MIRPTMSMPIFWEAQTKIEPMTLILISRKTGAGASQDDRTHQITDPIMMDVFLPNRSERIPEISAPIQDPPAMDAVIPP